MSDTKLKKVLIIDDNSDYRKLIKTFINKLFPGVELIEHDPVFDGIPDDNFDWSDIDVLLLDYHLSIVGTTGLDVLHKHHKKHSFPATIMLTGAGTEEIAIRALKFGIYEYQPKQSLTKDKLKQSIVHAWEDKKNERKKKQEITQHNKSFSKEVFYETLEQVFDHKENERALIIIKPDDIDMLEEEIGIIGRDNLINHIAKNSFEVFKLGACNPNITRISDTEIGIQIDYPINQETLEFNMQGLSKHLAKCPFKFSDEKYKYSVSIGVLKLGFFKTTAEQLISIASAACKKASSQEGNSYYIWKESDAIPETSEDDSLSSKQAVDNEIVQKTIEEKEDLETRLKVADEAKEKAEAAIQAEHKAKTKLEADLIIVAEAKEKAEEELKKVVAVKEEAEAKRLATEKADNEIISKAQAELKAKQDAREKAEQETKVEVEHRIEAELKAEAEMKAKLHAEIEMEAVKKAKEKLELELKAVAESREQAKAEAELRAEQEAKHRIEAELKSETEAEAKLHAEAEMEAVKEAKEKLEVELKAVAESREQAKAEAELRAEQEAKHRIEAELKSETEAKAKIEAELRAEQETKAKVEAELRAEQEAQQRIEAELKSEAEAEAKLHAEAEMEAVKEAKEKLETELKAVAEAKEKAEAEMKVAKQAKEKLEAELKAFAEGKIKSDKEEVKEAEPIVEKDNNLSEKTNETPAIDSEVIEDEEQLSDEDETQTNDIESPDTYIHEAEDQIRKLIDEKRIIQTYQPVTAMSSDGDDTREIYKTGLHAIVDDEKLNGILLDTSNFSISLQQTINEWILRQVFLRITESGTTKCQFLFLINVIESWFSDITLFSWLQKILSQTKKYNPGKSIILEVPLDLFLKHQKRAQALIDTLHKSHQFSVALSNINSLDDIAENCELTSSKLVLIDIDQLQKLSGYLAPCDKKRSGEDGEDAIKQNMLQYLKSKDVRIITFGIEDSTLLTDAITAGTDYTVGNFVGEAQDNLVESQTVESFELT